MQKCLTVALGFVQLSIIFLFIIVHTLGPAYNEQKDAKETARYKWVLVVMELFNMAVNDFDAKQSARYSRVLVVTELVLSGTQCNLFSSQNATQKS